MWQQRSFPSNTMKNHCNTVSQKGNDNFSAIEPKDMEYCYLPDKEFKIAVMKEFNELQENPERQYHNFRNKINKQKECFTKEIEILKLNQTNSGAEELNKWHEECIQKHCRVSRSDGRENK